MPFRRYGNSRSVKRSSLKTYEARRKRRRTSLPARIRYKPPTAYNQKRQMYSLARQVARNTKVIKTQKVYTDYQWGQVNARGLTALMNDGQWYGWELTDFSQWQPVMRRDQNVAQASRTFAVRMQLNCRANLGTVTQLCYMNVFIISPRSDATDGLTITDLVGGMTSLNADIDYIESTDNEGANLRLNSGLYKVHACKYMTLMPNTSNIALPANSVVGNPYTTWRKWQWNIPLKFTVRNPINRPWNQLEFDNLPYYEKLYFVAVATVNPNDTQANIFADAHITCINYD